MVYVDIATQKCLDLNNTECQKQQQAEDCFFRIAGIAIHGKENAGSLKSKLEQHKKDQIATRRAKAATAVYDIDIKGKLTNPPSCLKLIDTVSDASLRKLESDLGLKPNSLEKEYFSNEKNGYRAAVFYDQREEKYVVTFRGTNKNNLIDWKNNINNQLPDATESDAPSYFAAKKLGKALKNSKPPVEYAGHSKGGGEVCEALSNSTHSKATIFNSAGPSPRISDKTKTHIEKRTQHYQVGGEMLNLIQDETEPERTIKNMIWLRNQLKDGFWGTAAAMKITERDKVEIAQKKALNKRIGLLKFGDDEKAAKEELKNIKQKYDKDRDDFINKLNELIQEKEQWLKDRNAGTEVDDWESPFAEALGERRVLGGSPERDSVEIGAASDHTMSSMNKALEKQIKADRKEIEEKILQYEPDFNKKIEDCSSGN